MRIASQIKFRNNNIPFLVSVVRAGFSEVGFWNCLVYGLLAWSFTSFYYHKKLEAEEEKCALHRRYPSLDHDLIPPTSTSSRDQRA